MAVSHSRPAASVARISTVWPKATPPSVAVSKLEKGWKGLRLICVRSTAALRKFRSKNALCPTSTARVQSAARTALRTSLEYALQRVLLRNRGPQRMVRIDAVHRQRGRLHVRAGKRRDVIAVGFAARKAAVAAHLDQHRGDLQQRVGLRIEAAGLHVDDHRQKAAKARREGDRRQLGHGVSPGRARRQLIDLAGAIRHHAAAAELIASPAPATARRTRVIVSAWRGRP